MLRHERVGALHVRGDGRSPQRLIAALQGSGYRDPLGGQLARNPPPETGVFRRDLAGQRDVGVDGEPGQNDQQPVM